MPLIKTLQYILRLYPLITLTPTLKLSVSQKKKKKNHNPKWLKKLET